MIFSNTLYIPHLKLLMPHYDRTSKIHLSVKQIQRSLPCYRTPLSHHEKMQKTLTHDKLIKSPLNENIDNIDNRNIRGVHLCQDNLHLLQSGKNVLCNNFISYLNSNFLMHPHPLQTCT